MAKRSSATSRRRPSSRPRSSPPTAPAGRSPKSGERTAGPPRAARERRAVLAAGRRQRVRRRDGRARTLDPAARRAPGLRLGSSAAVLSFIVAFGVAKALTNLAAGALAQRAGRRRLLIAGWAPHVPVPLLIAVAPSWGWIVAANALLGINQGLAWSMTVVMKIDLVGPRRRGLALGLNESAGYGGVALAAGLSGWLAASFAARDVLVVAGAVHRGHRLPALGPVRARHRSARRARAGARSRTRRQRHGADPPPRVRAGQLPRARACAPAHRPGWSTTSTTASPGAWSRCTSPPTAPPSARSDSSPRSIPASGASRRSPPDTGQTASDASP